MENILEIIQNKNPEDVTDREFSTFQEKIEETLCYVNKLQRKHRELTGQDYIPNIRLR